MISVVIPLYNKAHTIVNTLNTVINQSYKDFEVIIVNDGSTDNGVEVIQKHFTDNRIRIINQKNAGVSAARNKGVEESKGEWIAFLDGDDEWHPEYLSIMQSLIHKYSSAGLFLCAGLIHNADGSISYRIASKYEGIKSPINLFHNPEVFSHTSATIVNKNIFNKTHRFIVDMHKFEDYLAFQATALITPVIYCGLPLTKYNGGIKGQLTQQNKHNPQTIQSEIKYFNILMQDYKQSNYKDKTFIIFIKYFLRHSFKIMLQQNDKEKINTYIYDLSSPIKQLFNPIEFYFIKKYRYIAILWINLTKIRWRLYGFPIVGQKINLLKIPTQYIKW